MNGARHILFLLLGVFLWGLVLSHCGGPGPGLDEDELESETAIATIGGAVLITQGQGKLAYLPPVPAKEVGFASLEDFFSPELLAHAEAFPTTVTDCPLVTTQDATKVTCAGPRNDAVDASLQGQYLELAYNVCQFSGQRNAGTWRIFHVLKFPDQTSCQAINTSSDGFTDKNVTAAGLTGKTITVTYGLGRNGNQDNFRISTSNQVIEVYSDFASGWVEPRIGGYDVTFIKGVSHRQVTVNGLHVMSFKPTQGQPNPSPSDFSTYANSDMNQILNKLWDETLASPQATDRLYENSDASQDPLDSPAPLDITMDGKGTTTVAAGGAIRVQQNIPKGFGRLRIVSDLKYTDPTCCYPTSGEVEHVFTHLYSLPEDENGRFDDEKVTFTAKCGLVQVVHSAGTSVNTAGTFQLTHCF